MACLASAYLPQGPSALEGGLQDPASGFIEEREGAAEGGKPGLGRSPALWQALGHLWGLEGNKLVPPSKKQSLTVRRSHFFGRTSPTLGAICKMISLKRTLYYLKTDFDKIVQTFLYGPVKLG